MIFKHPFKSPTAWNGIQHKLKQFLGEIDPINTIVEIGVDKGFSICHFAHQHPNARVIGVDSWKWGDGPDAKDMLDRICPKEFPNIELWHMDSADGAEKYQSNIVVEGDEIDVLHIDANHEYDAVKKDFQLWEPMVRSGGVVLFHDVESFPDDVGRFFGEIPGQKRSIAQHSGFGAWYKP